MRNVFCKFAMIFVFFLSVVSTLSAQQLATLNVTVTDPSGAAIPNAQVSVQNADTAAKRTDSANSDGYASLPALQAVALRLNF